MRPKREKTIWAVAMPGILTVLLGMAVMEQSGIASAIWIQNGLGLLLGLLGIMVHVYCFRCGAKGAFGWMLLMLGLLTAVFFFPGVREIHRWITLGSVQIYVASLVLPGMIILLARFQQKAGSQGFILVSFWCITVLGLQPDAAQLTAFSAAILLLLFTKRDPMAWWTLGFVTIAAVIVWIWRDSLPPVAHVEGIVGMAFALDRIWGIAAVAALILLPAPFFLWGLAKLNYMYLALGVYFSLILLGGWWGNFPIPLLGYGFTPIVGYFWAVSVLSHRYPSK